MANSIDLEKILVKASAGLDVNFFMKSLGSMDYSSKYTNESGETINVKIHNYPSVHQTNDMTGLVSSMETKSVPLTVAPYMSAFSYLDVEDSFELADKDVFMTNAGKKIADTVNDIAYNSALFGANTGVVISSGSADFGTLSKGQIVVGSARMEGRINAVLSSELRGIVLDSAKTNQAFSAAKLAEQYQAGNISSWNGTNWADYDRQMLTTDDIFPAGSFTITNTAGIYGGTVANFTPTSSVGTALTIKKGTAFTLAGVKAVSIDGKVRSADRLFIVQEDTTIPTGTGATAVNIGQVFFTGALKNVSVSAISALAVTNKLEADTSYYTGAIFKDTELLMAMPDLKELKGIVSSSIKSTEGCPIRVSYDGDALTSSENLVFKTMFGSRLYTGNGAYAIYQKMA